MGCERVSSKHKPSRVAMLPRQHGVKLPQSPRASSRSRNGSSRSPKKDHKGPVLFDVADSCKLRQERPQLPQVRTWLAANNQAMNVFR